MSGHETFDELAAAYAIGALDPGDRPAFEAHLSTCAICQVTVRDLSPVVTGLALGADAVAPPADLRARTIAHATGAAPGRTPIARARSWPGGWLAAAATLVVALGLGLYAWSLHSRVQSLEALLTTAASQLERVRAELVGLRRDSTRLVQTAHVLGADDVVRIGLRSASGDSSVTGAFYWSASAGLVVSIDGLPNLGEGRVYQLWVIPDRASPVSAGLLSMSATGAATFVAPAAAVAAVPGTVAVTAEPAGGSPAPTSAPIVLGSL